MNLSADGSAISLDLFELRRVYLDKPGEHGGSLDRRELLSHVIQSYFLDLVQLLESLFRWQWFKIYSYSNIFELSYWVHHTYFKEVLKTFTIFSPYFETD